MCCKLILGIHTKKTGCWWTQKRTELVPTCTNDEDISLNCNIYMATYSIIKPERWRCFISNWKWKTFTGRTSGRWKNKNKQTKKPGTQKAASTLLFKVHICPQTKLFPRVFAEDAWGSKLLDYRIQAPGIWGYWSCPSAFQDTKILRIEAGTSGESA